MTNKEFIEKWIAFSKSLGYAPAYDPSEIVDRFIAEHNSQYFDVEHIKKPKSNAKDGEQNAS